MKMSRGSKEITVIIGLIIVSFAFAYGVFGAEIEWYSPTSADSENGECIGGTCWCYYDNCLNVWDENLESLTRDTYFTGWGKYLYLYRSGEFDTIRFNALYDVANNNAINVDVFYEGGWVNIYNGTYPDHTWVNVEIPAGRKNVEKARVKIYTSVRYERRIYEFDFGSSFYFLSFDTDDLATTTAYIGDVFEDVGFLIYFGTGIPLAFYVIRKIIMLFKR